MYEQIQNEMSRIIRKLQDSQAYDGSWNDPFETGISTDAYMIILLRTLKINDEELIRKLSERIISRQEKNGAWKLFYDEGNGNVSVTVEAYYALLYSGFYKKEDIRVKKAKSFILANGGIENTHMFTAIMLALTGQLPWPAHFPLPAETVLLPLSFPINFYDFSVFGRANLAPLMIVAAKKYRKRRKSSPDLSDLFVSKANRVYPWQQQREFGEIFSMIEQGLKQLIGVPAAIHQLAIERAKNYMLDHIEPDGTLYSYFSSTFLMIFALLSLGYRKNDPVIKKAITGLKAMKCTIDGLPHMQYTTAAIWNTSLISYALQKAGVPPNEPMITKANQFLLAHQHYKYGDWAIHNNGVLPGGWGFSRSNTINPDVDDTTASLRAIAPLIQIEPQFHQAWDRGIQWIFSMQNKDGGWPAFEKNIDKAILNMLPIEGGKFLLNDASSADLTGRTLEFFGNYTHLPKNNDTIKRAVNWLLHHQEKDGSWYGRWGICYIYGTWAALTGLKAVGTDSQHQAITKAVKWLHSIQNNDGGWGESCRSDTNNAYTPLGASHLTQTAWAVDALIAISDKPTSEINAGISYLLTNFDRSDWTKSYPVGQGMGGGFYIHYHSYQMIFPLLALAHYNEKYRIKALI
ncbi:squalene--hopene cyclase [Bacillus sp. FJAT-50079]|uniref:squalene--hopene cyclase n=1 Tax=Bacillus sp. FJAT-50079 TaxID=2833577 RepID=UPI001BC92D7F|nr:squalene--hopene cyclase [Bacillus sp. FJAT-50079]MBS4207874.1 squalene--hopene cyclase [Bacillus sp. FJAT-50079]